MVSSIRRALKRPLFRDIVIWGMVLSLGLFYTVPEFLKRMTSDGIITVNDISITAEQFQAEVSTQQRKISYLFGQYGKNAKLLLEYSGMSSNPVELAYQVIVRQALIDSVAQKYNIIVDNDLLNSELVNLLPQGSISEDGRLNLPLELVEEIRRNLKNDIVGKMVLDFVKASAYAPEFAIKSSFIEKYSKHNYSILAFSFDDYLKAEKDKKVSDSELAAYYNKNKAKYFQEEKRGGKVWNFDADKYGIVIKDEEVKSYYEKNKPKYKDKSAEVKVARILVKHSADAKDKANTIHAQILQDPSKFAEIAKQDSDDADSASKGGALDYFKRGTKDQAFESTAFALTKLDPISEVIKTEDGYEILKFVDKKNATFKALKDVESEIKSELQKERFKKLFPVNARKAMSSSSKDSDLAKLKEKGRSGITYSKMPKGETKDIKKLFSLKAVGDVDFILDGDRGILVQLDEINPATTPNLKDIKDKVQGDYYKEKALDRLKSDVEKAKSEATSTPFGKLKERYKASERDIKDISGENRTVLNTLAGQGIPAYKMVSLQVPGALMTDVTEKGGYLIKLNNIDKFDQKLFDEKKAEIKKELQGMQAQVLPEAFIASLKKDAKININDERLKLQLKGLL